MIFLIIAHAYTKALIYVFGQPLSSEPHTALLGSAWYVHAIHVDLALCKMSSNIQQPASSVKREKHRLQHDVVYQPHLS